MPNIRGGKGYKRGKGDNDDEAVFLVKEPGQMIGRIIRALGDLNMSVFCEDNITRICKVAMGIKKKVRFTVGDIVLISLRDCLVSKAELLEGKRSDRGDILGKFHQEQFAQLKESGNKFIFANVEILTEIQKKLSVGDLRSAEQLATSAENDDLFDYSKEEEEEQKEGKEGEKDANGNYVTKPIGWKSQREAKLQSEINRDIELHEL